LIWFAENLIETLLIIAVVLLIVEVAVLGFSTFFLFFAGLGALITALLIWTGVLPETFLSSIVAVAISTAILAAVLWKPMRKMQAQVDDTRPKSDLIGHRLTLTQALDGKSSLSHQYSGIAWQVKSTDAIDAGTEVEVIQADVGVLWVKAAD